MKIFSLIFFGTFFNLLIPTISSAQINKTSWGKEMDGIAIGVKLLGDSSVFKKGSFLSAEYWIKNKSKTTKILQYAEPVLMISLCVLKLILSKMIPFNYKNIL